ncbi:Uncharacterised protein [Dermatophilus congolensis]|uniref:Uncharacterized protein n=1 Tax=Dermatophilus congolensis TaxID=1863 RepID=A0A239VL38_9MICO|nr:Uncharacterised protein [Dermatophilus congolensis]
MGRPESKDSIWASWVSRDSTMSAMRMRMRARSRAIMPGQGPWSNAFFAAATARSMSALVPAAAWR